MTRCASLETFRLAVFLCMIPFWAVRARIGSAAASAAWALGDHERSRALTERALADLQGTRTPQEVRALAGSTVFFTFQDLDGRPGLARAREAVALADELRRLGYAVDGLDTMTSARAGLSARRDEVTVAATVDLDDADGTVRVQLHT